jgi:hypothetical protein
MLCLLVSYAAPHLPLSLPEAAPVPGHGVAWSDDGIATGRTS